MRKRKPATPKPRDGPPHAPCWHCIVPTVCVFQATCPAYLEVQRLDAATRAARALAGGR